MNNTVSNPSTMKANSFQSRTPPPKNPYSKRSLTPNPHIPLEQTSSASACIRIPQHHNATPTHIEPGMCKLIYKTSEYVQETLSKTYHTKKKTQ